MCPGMTETSPLASIGGLKPAILKLPDEEQLKVVEQARPHILADMRLINDSSQLVPHDGKTSGALQVRGPLVLSAYYNVSPAFL